MNYTIEQIRAAHLAACIAEWSSVVRDDDGGREGNRSTITGYFRATGWAGWLEGVTGGGYRETPRTSWCGQFAAAMGLRVGDYIEPGICVPISLDYGVAHFCMVSTERLPNPKKWIAAGAPMPDIYLSKGDGVIRKLGGLMRRPEEVLLPGVIATVKTSGNKPELGDHIVTIEAYDPSTRTFTTVEGNGRGLLGDGKRGEGVVRNEKPLSDLRRVYHLGLEHYETMERP